MTQPIPVPAFGGGSLTDVLPAVLAGLDVPGEAAALDIPVSPRMCVVLIDGLGWHALRARPKDAPYLTSLLGNAGSRAITSVFPTTTPIALTSLGTGLSPGEHGIVGLLLRLPEDGRVVDTLANPAQVDMRALQPRPTAFERAVAAGVDVTRIGPRHFDGAGLSEAGLRGGRYAGAETMGECVDATSDAIRRGERALAYVYLGTLDATGHRRGCTSSAWVHELTHIDRVVEQIANALPAGSALVVTSDHGMVDVPFENRWDVADTPSLSDGVEVVAGDLRGVHVHALPGASADVLAAWRATLSPDFWVVSRDEAIEAGLYGPVLEQAYHRIGDVVALASDTSAVVDSRVMSPGLLALVGLHGSVTEDELVIPLLTAVTA